MDDRLTRAVEELRRMPSPSPAARHRLSQAVGRESRPHRRVFALTPGPMLLAASLLIAITSAFWVLAPGLRPERAAPAATSHLTPVQFVFVAPGARSVALAGDFNQWSPTATPLTADAGAVWSVVVPLGLGAFTYSFIVDGREWRADPSAPAAPDDYGHPSSVIYVAMEERP